MINEKKYKMWIESLGLSLKKTVFILTHFEFCQLTTIQTTNPHVICFCLLKKPACFSKGSSTKEASNESQVFLLVGQ